MKEWRSLKQTHPENGGALLEKLLMISSAISARLKNTG